MIKVCIESPFKPSADDVALFAGRYTRAELLRQNLVYARLALLDALRRCEAPIASHLLYTQVWSESFELRSAGIKAGIEWAHRADLVALYTDLGVSGGMKVGRDNARLIGCPITDRRLLGTCEIDEVREELAGQRLGGFPYLDELLEAEHAERTSSGRVKLS